MICLLYISISNHSAYFHGSYAQLMSQLHLCSSHPRCLNMTMYGIPPYSQGHTTFWLTLLIQDNLWSAGYFHPPSPAAPSFDEHVLRYAAVEESALVVHRHLYGNNATR